MPDDSLVTSAAEITVNQPTATATDESVLPEGVTLVESKCRHLSGDRLLLVVTGPDRDQLRSGRVLKALLKQAWSKFHFPARGVQNVSPAIPADVGINDYSTKPSLWQVECTLIGYFI